ncbi:hypothetical protein QEM14_003456 [Pseudomonas putida]|nr:hypothetical protein [Pseudomonas putida]
MSIGVSGGWGAGKSSLVKMIASRLENLPAAGAIPATAGQAGAAETPQNTRTSSSRSTPGFTKILRALAVHCCKSSAMRCSS